MAGGKGGTQTQTTEVTLPPEMEQGAIGALAGALRSASLEYTPNRAPSIATFTPQQRAAFQGANAMANAYGTGGTTSEAIAAEMPAGEATPMGFRALSTGALYDDMVAKSVTPEQLAQREAVLQGYARSAENVQSDPVFSALRLGDNWVPPTADNTPVVAAPGVGPVVPGTPVPNSPANQDLTYLGQTGDYAMGPLGQTYRQHNGQWMTAQEYNQQFNR